MKQEPTDTRSTEEVFEDHLWLGERGSVEDDLARNYAPEVLVLTSSGVHHGHDGVRRLAEQLRQKLPEAKFTYTTRRTAGEVAFLEWTAEAADGARVRDGADSFVIRNGRIQGQTIHYTVLPGDQDATKDNQR
jgi:hypothetical protein